MVISSGLIMTNPLRDFLLSELESQDHTDEPVPLVERRGSLTMGLLWITMVTCFPCVLVGFTWYKEGLPLPAVLWSLLSSCLIIVVYSIPACYLGSKTGLTFALLSRFVFGRWGSRFVSFNSIWVSVGWYALNAIFLAEGLRGLFHIPVPHGLFVALIAVAMSANNFFGFTGVANFARFLAAPVLLIWVGIAFVKSQASCPADVWTAPSHISGDAALTTVSAFVLGIACWGNEADYWRYGRPDWKQPVLPLVLSLAIGQVLFPITGWMMARLTGITDFAGATSLMTDYVFGGLVWISAAVLVITYVAVNDAGLYAAINAAENMQPMPRKLCVTALAAAGALGGVALLDYKHNFEAVASLSCIFLPCATVIMMAEIFVLRRFFKLPDFDFARIPDYTQLPFWKPAAVLSLLAGTTFGTIAAGFLPGTESLAHGIPPLEAWLVSFFIYFPLRCIEMRVSRPAFESHDEKSGEEVLTRLD